MSKMDKLKEIIRELIKKELDEASTSAATPGYQTPYAFSVEERKIKKEKEKGYWFYWLQLCKRRVDIINIETMRV